MKKLLNWGNSTFFFLTLLWLFFTIYFTYQYLNVDFTNINVIIANLLIIVSFSIVLIFHFRNVVLKLIKFVWYVFQNHKLLAISCLVVFQVAVLLSSVGLASSDTTIIYNIATSHQFAKTTDYISLNPNNYLLVLWYKLNALISFQNLVVILAFWNIFFIDYSIYFLSIITNKVSNKKIADIVFILSFLILGFSPQYIYTYSDPITLFLLTNLIFLIVKSNDKSNNILNSILIGIILAISYGFRPTVFIFMIAGFIVLFYKFIKMKPKRGFSIIFKKFIISMLFFLVTNFSISYSLNHQNEIRYNPEQNRTLLYYVNLGLTYSGNLHSDISKKVWNSRGDNRNKLAKKEIEERIDNYTYNTFVGHLYYKYYWMSGEGNFGWYQERVLSESTRLNLRWLQRIQNGRTAKFIRSFIYVEGKYYTFFATFIQLVWISIVFGLVLYSFYYSDKLSFNLWMQITIFGALAFLIIFEAGRTRYMYQFMPAILFISSFGYGNLYEKLSLRKVN